MLRHILCLSACLGLASCTVYHVDASKSAREPSTHGAIAENATDPNSPRALTFGTLPTAHELAEEQGIPLGGGIRQGVVVALPEDDEWSAIEARAHGRGIIHVKAISRGESIVSAGKGRSLGIVHLEKARIPVISLSEEQDEACMVLLDGTGEPVTLRDNETGIDRYAFIHPINQVKSAYQMSLTQLSHAQEQVDLEREKLESLQFRLSDNPAYQGGQCLTVKQRPIPPAPQRIDPEKLRTNAHGACVNLLGSRFTEEQVVEALESAGRYDITKDYQTWAFGEKLSCASGVTISEFESLKTRAFNVFLPEIGKDYFRQAMRKDIDRCIAEVKRRCDDGYNKWLAEKSRIVREPKRLKDKCEADRHKLDHFNHSAYNEAKAKLVRLYESHDKAYEQQKSFDRTSFIPFTDKRTYCRQWQNETYQGPTLNTLDSTSRSQLRNGP